MRLHVTKGEQNAQSGAMSLHPKCSQCHGRLLCNAGAEGVPAPPAKRVKVEVQEASVQQGFFEQVAGCVTASEAAQLAPGDAVEVRLGVAGFRGAWLTATVLQASPRSCHSNAPIFDGDPQCRCHGPLQKP